MLSKFIMLFGDTHGAMERCKGPIISNFSESVKGLVVIRAYQKESQSIEKFVAL